MSNCSENPNGPGCLNGQVYCNDPRCYPNCSNCSTNTSSGNWIIITIILILLGVLLVMAFIVGFDWYKKTKKANEPKNITVNKHIHNIKQPDVVVSPAVVTVPEPFPVNSNLSVNNESMKESFSSPNPISYEGVNLTMNENLPC